MTESEIRDVESVRVPNAADQALLEFGQSLAAKSVDTLVDFAKIMVTLISGLFATYFALLKFVGLGAAQTLGNNPILLVAAATPPILFIVSLLFVVLGALFPIGQVIALNDLGSIKEARSNLLARKYRSSKIAVTLFVAGMAVMMTVFLALL